MKQTEGGSLMEDLQQFFEEAEKAAPEELEALNAELFKDKPAPAPDRQPRKPEYNPEDPAFDLEAYLKQSDALNAIADAYIDAKKAPKKVKVDLPEPDPELDPNNPAANPDKIRDALNASADPKTRERMQGTIDALAELAQKTGFLDFAQNSLLDAGKTQAADHLRELIAAGIDSTDFLLRVYKAVLLQMAELPPEELEQVKEEIAASAQAEDVDENQITFFDSQAASGLPPAKKKARQTPKLDAITAEAIAEVKGNLILQGTATNAFTKMRPTKRNVSVDAVTGTATIKSGDVTYYLTHYSDITDPRTSTYQLLDALTEILTDTGAREPAVEMPITEYMEKRGLKDYKETRKQVEQDLETLFNASMSFRENRNGKEQNFMDMRICDAKGIKNGVIQFSFGSTFFSLLRTYAVMPNHPLLYRINGKRNPYSYFLLRKLLEHKNMNAGKKNENVIAVKTLLKACEGLPTRAEIEATDRHYDTRIIKPFERDLDALESALTWEYCHRNGEPLTDEELSSYTYDDFESFLILTTWKDYPDQTQRLADRQAKIDAARAKKAATEKKRRRGRPKKSERE